MGRRPMCLVCLFLMAAICLLDWFGILRIVENPLPDSVQEWIREHPQSVISGEVQRCQDTEYSQSIYLKSVSLLYDSQKISIENVRVFLNTKEEVPSGAFVVVSGKLEEVEGPRNPGEFDSKQYYACQHIFYFMKDGVVEHQSDSYSGYRQLLNWLRERISKVLEAAAGTDAPVFQAMVLGEKEDLDESLKMRYQLAGVIHILAISGLHISMLGMGLFSLLKKTGIGIYPAGMTALFVMLQYGILTGESVSAMRAVCMFLLSVGAKILGRIYDMLTAMALAAILLLLESPAYLYSSSFLLSFGAVVGLGTVVPALDRLLEVKGKFGKSLVSSAGVQMTMLPILLYFYGEVSIAGIVLNLVVLPTVGVVLVSGAAGGILGLLWPVGAFWSVIPGRAFLFLYEGLCKMAGKVPWAAWIGGQPQMWQIVCYYGLLAAALVGGNVLKRNVVRGNKSNENVVCGSELSGKLLSVILCVCLFCFGIFFLSYRKTDGLKITCLDVGQGDAIVLETPENHHYLVDGGSSNQKNIGQYQLLPYLKSQGISYLDAVFVSHTDQDHISGIAELLTFIKEDLTTLKIGTLVLPDWEEKPEAYRELETLAVAASVEIKVMKQGDLIRDESVEFAFLAPEMGAKGSDVNEEGMVFEVCYGDFRTLFTGDIGEEAEESLLPVLGDIDYLKVAHHGSRYSTGQEFLRATKPEIGVISCSDSNTYGHPSPETVERLGDVGCHVEYTMKSGAVTVVVKEENAEVYRFLNDS